MVLGGTGRRRLPTSLSTASIRNVWRYSRDATAKPAAPGVDGIRAAKFSSDIADHVERIRQEIRAGTYRFNRLRLAPLPKDCGAYRILAIPTVRDRLVQRALLRHLEADVHFQPSSAISYGFAKQRTLADAQRAALSLRHAKPWVLKCDIVSFFDRIPRSHLKALITRKVGWKVIAGLLCQAVDCELHLPTLEDIELVRENGIQSGIGLRQGMPVSPMLSNLLLKRFDERLEKRGIVAVRYADDIAVFAQSRSDCLAALAAIQEDLAEIDLQVPDLMDDGKTSVLGPSEVAEFLGVDIRREDGGYRLCAPMKKLKRIEAAMLGMVQVKSCIEQKRNIGHVVRALDSFTIGHAASMAVLNDGGAFMARLEAAKRHQLRALLINLFGKSFVDGLSHDHLAILGVESFN